MIVGFYERFRGRAELQAPALLPVAARGPARAHPLAGRDLVSGGNTANMLAIWRVHGFDAVLREAWEAGVVLWARAPG